MDIAKIVRACVLIFAISALIVSLCVYQYNEKFIGVDDYAIADMDGNLQVLDIWGEIHTSNRLTIYPRYVRDTYKYNVSKNTVVNTTYWVSLPEDGATRLKLHEAMTGHPEYVERMVLDAMKTSINQANTTHKFVYDGKDTRAICDAIYEDLKKPDSMLSKYGLKLLDFSMYLTVTMPIEQAMPKYVIPE